MKNAVIVGSGISNWLTAMSPLARSGAADVLCTHQSVGAGHDDNGVVGIGKGDDGGSGVRLGRLLDEGEVYALRGEKRPQFPPE